MTSRSSTTILSKNEFHCGKCGQRDCDHDVPSRAEGKIANHSLQPGPGCNGVCVFGLGQPSREELEDPDVIVGDIGVPGCEAIGHRPEINNFDHHYSNATRSATFLFNEYYHAMREDLVDYIDQVDTRPCPEESESTLRVAVAGIRVCHRHAKGKDHVVLDASADLLSWIERTGCQPDALGATCLPPHMLTYLDEGREELRRIRDEVLKMGKDYTLAGRQLGYVVTSSTVFSLVKEEMFAAGPEIAVAHNPAERRYSLVFNPTQVRGINLRDGNLLPSLNAMEHEKGAPQDNLWGGHEDRIGGPRAGSFLEPDEVLSVVLTSGVYD